MLGLPEDYAVALKHVGVLKVYKILLIYEYVVHFNKLYKMLGKYMKIIKKVGNKLVNT